MMPEERTARTYAEWLEACRTQWVPPEDRGPCKRLVVLASGRTGSTLLCKSLEAAGIGYGREHWHQMHIGAHVEARRGERPDRLSADYVLGGGYLAELDGYQHGGWVVHKVQGSQVGDSNQVLPESAAKALVQGADAVIVCKRRDRVAQAVSYARAMQDQAWHHDPDREPADLSMVQVLHGLTACANDDAVVHRLAAYATPVWHVMYEDLRDDYSVTMQHVCEWLGEMWPSIETPTQQQTDRSQRRIVRIARDYLADIVEQT